MQWPIDATDPSMWYGILLILVISIITSLVGVVVSGFALRYCSRLKSHKLAKCQDEKRALELNAVLILSAALLNLLTLVAAFFWEALQDLAPFVSMLAVLIFVCYCRPLFFKHPYKYYSRFIGWGVCKGRMVPIRGPLELHERYRSLQTVMYVSGYELIETPHVSLSPGTHSKRRYVSVILEARVKFGKLPERLEEEKLKLQAEAYKQLTVICDKAPAPAKEEIERKMKACLNSAYWDIEIKGAHFHQYSRPC